jgi:predicted DCC family thiol-disulfide oxidoreductase YuxK
LFLLEGGLTILSAVAAFFILPKDLKRAYFLTKEQREVGINKMLADSLDQEDAGFNWSDAFREFKTIHIYIRIVIIFSFGVLIGTNSNFLPIIVRRLGYSVVKTNLVSQQKERASAGTYRNVVYGGSRCNFSNNLDWFLLFV